MLCIQIRSNDSTYYLSAWYDSRNTNTYCVCHYTYSFKQQLTVLQKNINMYTFAKFNTCASCNVHIQNNTIQYGTLSCSSALQLK